MSFSNSSLVTYTKLSPNYSVIPNRKITDIVIHHMAGKLSVIQCGSVFNSTSRGASSNYGVCGTKVGLYVPEKYRAWTTSSRALDSRAVTIEVSNSTLSPTWQISDSSLKTTIKLCVDICKRNGIKKLNWTGNKNGNLHLHKWYAPTSCAGPYVSGKMKYIADEVNKLLGASSSSSSSKSTVTTSTTTYSVKTLATMNVRKSYKDTSEVIGSIDKGKTFKVSKTRTDGKEKWVYSDDKKGWVCFTGASGKTYLEKVVDSSKTYYKVTSKSGMNVRESYSTSSKIVGTIGYNKTFVTTKSHKSSKDGTWVYSSSKKGWVCQKGASGTTYLKKVDK